MKLQRIVKFLSVSLLLGIFFYAISVKEIHYAFSAKHQIVNHNDKCEEHHIHSSDQEEDCFICKMDVIGLFHFSESHYSFAIIFLPKEIISKPAQILYSTQLYARSLRGPPSIA
jgi:hypothetical protein